MEIDVNHSNRLYQLNRSIFDNDDDENDDENDDDNENDDDDVNEDDDDDDANDNDNDNTGNNGNRQRSKKRKTPGSSTSSSSSSSSSNPIKKRNTRKPQYLDKFGRSNDLHELADIISKDKDVINAIEAAISKRLDTNIIKSSLNTIKEICSWFLKKL
jgi:hypothetical protein